MNDTNHDIRVRFGRNLSAERNRNGYTQRDLADKASITYQQVSNIERGKAAPMITTAVRLADALDVSVGTLVEGGAE